MSKINKKDWYDAIGLSILISSVIVMLTLVIGLFFVDEIICRERHIEILIVELIWLLIGLFYGIERMING